MPTPSPFVIWTLQRTGGTNLTSQLVARSGLPSCEHEALNIGRRHGAITERWVAQRDAARLDADLAAMCASGQIFKHCVELVPAEVSQGLARAASAAGYQHLFLYRRTATDRLLSFHFARRTGIWGPKGAGEALASGQAEAQVAGQTLPVEELIRHQRRCDQALQQVWDALVAAGQRPLAVAYEDIYGAGPDAATRTLEALLGALLKGHPANPAADRQCIARVLGEGRQGTRDLYGQFDGLEALREGVAALPGFRPVLPAGSAAATTMVALNARRAKPLPAVVAHFALDAGLGEQPAGQPLAVRGTLLCQPGTAAGGVLQWQGPAGAQPARWGLASAKLAEKHPGRPEAAQARFRADLPAGSTGTWTLTLTLPGRPAHVLLTVQPGAAAKAATAD